jgi:hypothetical protein
MAFGSTASKFDEGPADSSLAYAAMIRAVLASEKGSPGASARHGAICEAVERHQGRISIS